VVTLRNWGNQSLPSCERKPLGLGNFYRRNVTFPCTPVNVTSYPQIARSTHIWKMECNSYAAEILQRCERIKSVFRISQHQFGTISRTKTHCSVFRYTSYGGGFAALWRYRVRSSQEYLTPGCQVLGGYKKLCTLPDMISSPGSHFAVLDHVKII